MSVLNLKAIYSNILVGMLFQLAPHATELNELGNRNRLPSTSSEERTPSSDSEDNKTIQEHTLKINSDDPLEELYKENEFKGLNQIDTKQYKNGAKYFFRTTENYSSTLSHLFYGGLYETNLVLSRELY